MLSALIQFPKIACYVDTESVLCVTSREELEFLMKRMEQQQ